MDRSIFITGIKHCGKSTLGNLLSSKLNSIFYDLDGLIEENRGISCRELFREFGRDEFQKEEAKALEKLIESNTICILATGGGVCDNSLAFNTLKEAGTVIYIDEDWEILFSRVAKGGIPPFLKSDNPKEEFMHLYNRRSKLYRDGADIIIPAKGRKPEEILKDLLVKLKEKNYVR